MKCSSTQPLLPELDDTLLGQFRHQPDKDQFQGAVHEVLVAVGIAEDVQDSSLDFGNDARVWGLLRLGVLVHPCAAAVDMCPLVSRGSRVTRVTGLAATVGVGVGVGVKVGVGGRTGPRQRQRVVTGGLVEPSRQPRGGAAAKEQPADSPGGEGPQRASTPASQGEQLVVRLGREECWCAHGVVGEQGPAEVAKRRGHECRVEDMAPNRVGEEPVSRGGAGAAWLAKERVVRREQMCRCARCDLSRFNSGGIRCRTGSLGGQGSRYR